MINSSKRDKVMQLVRWSRLHARLKAIWPGIFLALGLLFLPLGTDMFEAAASDATVPTFTITAVEKDASVTIRTANFPAGQTFTVTMGPMGTRGVNGTKVQTISSGNGGAFEAKFQIPAAVQGHRQIAVRLQTSHLFPYYSYNWFYNNSTGMTSAPETTASGTTAPAYSGIPTFRIVSVTEDESVTIETSNFPAGYSFAITMGEFGTRGINGIAIGTLSSGSGGKLTATFDIPEALKGRYRIAVRAQTSHLHPYYAYNWFYNNTTGGDDGGTGGPGPSPTPGYAGFPTFTVLSVKRNESVTFATTNLPAGQTFTVMMGAMGTRGVGGAVAGTFQSGSGGSLTVTMPIPAVMHGSYQIAIRAQTAHAYPYFAYNWFYNNTTP